MRKRFGLFIMVSVGLLLLNGTTAWAEPIRIGGTGAFISVMKQVADAYRQYHPDITFQFVLPPMGSSGAIKALTTHKLDVALSGRPLKGEEESAGLVQEWLGRSPFIFVVHQNSPVSHITLAQVTEMYAGRQKTWPDGSRVRVVLRPAADADTTLLKNISPAMNEAVTSAHANRQAGSAMADTDTDLVDRIEKIPGGFGAVAQAIVLTEHRPLKGLILDGVEPSVTTLDNRGYAHAKPLFLIIRADAPSQVVAFADFPRSTEGKSILPKFGVSVNKP